MQSGTTLLFMLALMVGMMFFMSRSQKKQYQKRMESLNKLQKGYEVIKTVVLDVDGVYLTFELTAIKTVLPVSEGVTAGAVEGAGDSDSIIDGE